MHIIDHDLVSYYGYLSKCIITYPLPSSMLHSLSSLLLLLFLFVPPSNPKMYEDWIGSLDENSAAPGTKQVLQAYFNESIPASDAATSLLDSLECSVERLAFLLIKASQEIPDSQPMLVELVQALRQLEGIDLKEFGWTMRDRWNCTLSSSSSSYQLYSHYIY